MILNFRATSSDEIEVTTGNAGLLVGWLRQWGKGNDRWYFYSRTDPSVPADDGLEYSDLREKCRNV